MRKGVSLILVSPLYPAVVIPATTVLQVGFRMRTRTDGVARLLTGTRLGLSALLAVRGWRCTCGRPTSIPGACRANDRVSPSNLNSEASLRCLCCW